jgi:hypothetical protein
VETDDAKRGACGVAVSLLDLQNGQLRLVLDDVKNERGAAHGPWLHHTLFTFKDYAAADLAELKLSEKELADFGYSVLARLGALREHPIT